MLPAAAVEGLMLSRAQRTPNPKHFLTELQAQINGQLFARRCPSSGAAETVLRGQQAAWTLLCRTQGMCCCVVVIVSQNKVPMPCQEHGTALHSLLAPSHSFSSTPWQLGLVMETDKLISASVHAKIQESSG